jgi:hypothetical protein
LYGNFQTLNSNFSETKSERSKQIIDSESTRQELSKNAIIFEKFRWASNLEIRLLIDLFEMLQNLEELYIDSDVHVHSVNHNQAVVTVAFDKGRNLKKVEIGDARILQYMPEIEELLCDLESEESNRALKKYLESHNQLKKLFVWFKNTQNFPSISLGNIHFELDSLCLDAMFREDSFLLNNHAIDFIKSQAKSLKYLDVECFTYNLDIIQELFDGMEKLENVHISGRMEAQITEFVGRNFECTKMKILELWVDKFKYPELFRKFPNLDFYCYHKLSGLMVDSLVQNCRQITKLYIGKDFDEAFQNATFRELVKFVINRLNEGSESSFEGFLARHQKLKELKLSFKLKKEILLKLPVLLPNVDDFEFYQFDGFDEDDLKNLLASWDSIKNLTIKSCGQRALDLEAATKDIHRRITICQYTGAGKNILIK